MGAPQHRDRGKLSGLIRAKLIRELALGAESQTVLGERYDVSQGAISQFAKRNAHAIAEIRDSVNDEFAGLLITEKRNRLMVYEEMLNIALTPTPKMTQGGVPYMAIDPETGQRAQVMEVDLGNAAKVLKQAAEELGQLPTRLQLSGEMQMTTRYVIDGVDNAALT